MPDYFRLEAERLEALRTERGLDRTALARLAGVSQRTIARIEGGRSHYVRSGTLRRIRAALAEAPLATELVSSRRVA